MIRKFFAIAMICACTANASYAEAKQPKSKVRPRTEILDAASKSTPAKGNKSWEKQKKENEKKWRKHMA